MLLSISVCRRKSPGFQLDGRTVIPMYATHPDAMTSSRLLTNGHQFNTIPVTMKEGIYENNMNDCSTLGHAQKL